jgi:hypothetical protein
MKFSSCRGPGLRDTRAHAKPYRSTVPRIFHACRGRRGASNKSPQKREKVVGPRLSRGPARRRHVAGMRPHDRRDRSFGSPAPESPSRHRDWTTLPDARKDGTMQNPTEIVTIARSLSGKVTAKSGMRSHYPSPPSPTPHPCPLEFFPLWRWILLVSRFVCSHFRRINRFTAHARDIDSGIALECAQQVHPRTGAALLGIKIFYKRGEPHKSAALGTIAFKEYTVRTNQL